MAISARDTKDDFILLLNYHLLNHPPFHEKLVNLNADFPHMKRYPWEWLNSPAVEKLRKHDYLEYEAIKEYREQLQELASSYNLNAEWALELVHRGVGDPTPAGMVPAASAHVRAKKYSINWNDADPRSKQEIRRDILRQFEQQWAEHRQKARSTALGKLRGRSKLKDRTGWVFKRICLKQSWDELAREANRDADAVRREVEKLTGVLGL